VPNNFARYEVGNASCFQHRHGAVAQRVKRNLARFARLVTAFAGAFMSARSRLNKSGCNENVAKLIR
jgi:hypothetical protein